MDLGGLRKFFPVYLHDTWQVRDYILKSALVPYNIISISVY